jgi:outer membrane protein assembly factor BamD
MEKKRLEVAYENLVELKQVTAGTRLDGEVQFLLAENQFRQGNYAEAEVHYGTYLINYPEGPFSEKALYMRAFSKIKQIRKIAIGFLTFRSYIPHDRDVSILRESRSLYDEYIDRYPAGKWIDEAKQMQTELLVKEGEHELEIAAFYLKKDQPQAALARAERLLKGVYPAQIMTRARELIKLAGGDPFSDVDNTSP